MGSSWQLQRSLLGSASNSFALLQCNVAVSTGNLFVEREFFQSLGGFRELRFNHDWDFCLRAAAAAEPMVVRRPLYFYRLHGSNTILKSQPQAAAEADRILGDLIAASLSGTAPCSNPLAPQWPENRSQLLTQILGAGQGALVPLRALRDLALSIRASVPPQQPAGKPPATSRRTAVVILGMHRSGTSAVSRVLNLCGAFLPAELRVANAYHNPAGFWEPEAIISLNERVLRQAGGAWNRVGFALPDGEFGEEFAQDVLALLASEYGDAPTILIKDPRIGVLAPMWERALIRAGYRTVYVVPLRHPLEVARSLEARGDMTVPEGLALWLTYMQRIASFAESVPDVIHVRFTDLFDDWRGAVGRIAARLDLDLDIEARAADVDRFLVPSLRRQRSDAAALEALPAGPINVDVRKLYATLLSRCDVDARIAGRTSGTTHRRVEFGEGRKDAPRATASFVLCIENNALRAQALLLCGSIRRYGGGYRDSPILAFSPRAGLAVDRDTRQALSDLRVEYMDEPLNTLCTDYGSANRIYAGAWAETHSDTDFMVVLDSDTVFLREPEIPAGADVAVRPVDTKGSATRGPGDAFEAYWIALAGLAGTSLDRLPFLRATVDHERIRASYNGGLIVVRRDKGILARAAELFSRSVRAGLRPYRDSGIDILASTGLVGRAGSEYWGSNQAALTLAIWAVTDRVAHFPASYNVPLHLIASTGEIDPDWMAQSPVHLHYHYMFSQPRYEVAMEIMERLGVPGDRLAWLAERIPFREPSRARQVADAQSA